MFGASIMERVALAKIHLHNALLLASTVSTRDMRTCVRLTWPVRTLPGLQSLQTRMLVCFGLDVTPTTLPNGNANRSRVLVLGARVWRY